MYEVNAKELIDALEARIIKVAKKKIMYYFRMKIMDVDCEDLANQILDEIKLSCSVFGSMIVTVGLASKDNQLEDHLMVEAIQEADEKYNKENSGDNSWRYYYDYLKPALIKRGLEMKHYEPVELNTNDGGKND